MNSYDFVPLKPETFDSKSPLKSNLEDAFSSNFKILGSVLDMVLLRKDVLLVALKRLTQKLFVPALL